MTRKASNPDVAGDLIDVGELATANGRRLADELALEVAVLVRATVSHRPSLN